MPPLKINDLSDARPPTAKGTVVLGVTASDSHVVANHLIAIFLRAQGFQVINLGPCTPTEEFMRTASETPDLAAVLIGSLNGHAVEDLSDLPHWRAVHKVRAPVIVGGNLSVGALKSGDAVRALLGLGIDAVADHPRQLVAKLTPQSHQMVTAHA